ncbi:hypothetical protein XELAEV_18001737mg [Xenopus laevis]|nr:hypothetical protein XELAEV_18001737mg [Xenopus laevis]
MNKSQIHSSKSVCVFGLLQTKTQHVILLISGPIRLVVLIGHILNLLLQRTFKTLNSSSSKRGNISCKQIPHISQGGGIIFSYVEFPSLARFFFIFT